MRGLWEPSSYECGAATAAAGWQLGLVTELQFCSANT